MGRPCNSAVDHTALLARTPLPQGGSRSEQVTWAAIRYLEAASKCPICEYAVMVHRSCTMLAFSALSPTSLSASLINIVGSWLETKPVYY